MVKHGKLTELLPTGWIWTTLGDALRWGSGGTPTSSNRQYYGGHIPWLIINDLTDGVVARSQSTITQAGFDNSSAKWVEPGSVLLAMYGSIGKLGIAGVRLTTNQAIAFTNPAPINEKYLFYYLLSEKSGLSSLGKGATQRNISQTVIKTYPFALAPLNEQKRIVDAIETQFTRLDVGVAGLKTIQAKLKRYRAAVLKAAVEGTLTEDWRAQHSDVEPASDLLQRILRERCAAWELGELAKYAKAGRTPPVGWPAKYKEPISPSTSSLPSLPKNWSWATPAQLAAADNYALAIGPFGSNLKVEDYRTEGVPLIFVRNIRSGVFDGLDTHYIALEKAEALQAHRVIAGDVLITKMGDPPGDARLYPDNRPPGVITADCIKWTLSPALPEHQYFVHAINSQLIRKLIRDITQGVAQLKVSLGRFEKIAIPLPPVDEQEQIVAEVDRLLSVVDEGEAQIQVELKRAGRLRQSILKQAFDGTLVSQDPSDEPASALLERIRADKSRDTSVTSERDVVQLELV